LPGFIAGCSLLLCTCSNDGVVDTQTEYIPPFVEMPVEFGIYETGTRASELNTSDLESIGVFGYYTGVERWGWASANIPAALTPDYFFNKKIYRKSGAWTYDPPIKYWPVDTARKVSFFAYAPYLQNNSSVVSLYPAARTGAGAPTITYTPPTDVSKQIDLLSGALWDQTINHATAGKISFPMNHTLTKIAFSAALDHSEIGKSPGYWATIKAISISGIQNTGVLDLATGRWTLSDEPPADLEDYVLSVAGETLNSITFQTDHPNDSIIRSLQKTSGTDSGYLMLLPQKTTGALLNITFEKAKLDNSAQTISILSVPLGNISPEWAPGLGIEYLIRIKAEFIAIHTQSLGWNTSAVTDTCKVTY
jgi:hypothetical protein